RRCRQLKSQPVCGQRDLPASSCPRILIGSILNWGANAKPRYVRFGSKADIGARPINVRFTPKADIAQRDRHVRFVPKADSCTAAINATAIAGIAESSPAVGAG